MKKYAMSEVLELLRKADCPPKCRVWDTSTSSSIIRYLCAIFSELAYCYVPKFEIDYSRRAKLIPCEVYQKIIARGVRTSILAVSGRYFDMPSEQVFEVSELGIVAVGMAINKVLFVGFRGTQYLYDWKINLDSRLVLINYPNHQGEAVGYCHSGFSEEARRILILRHTFVFRMILCRLFLQSCSAT
jgi:hypothetical protein